MTHGFDVKSVHAGTLFNNPNTDNNKVPEHCPAINCLLGSKDKRLKILASSEILRVCKPLPNKTASAVLANSRGCCARTVTPFIEVTEADGHVICTFQPNYFMRLMILAAINESNSLNPSKVKIAMFMEYPFYL